MGKKTKTGKARQDKYYQLAKETGLRSRAAFKLLQLNRKFHFLEKSRVCIDLCAAPGGWLQVAQQNMPTSSLILGIDLVGIKPIHNVVTFQEDITTGKCRLTLRKELQTWKADVVLHDGAPNVGKNWIHDAFQQSQLTLWALKLATEFLQKGGWFVTKIFRSKDYNALLWVFKQLFQSVHATKPQASRNESAEIFVVCQNYRAPDKIDPKFLDVKHVFKDVGLDARPAINLMHPEKVKKKAEGYDDTDTAFHQKLPASKFISADNHTELLSTAHQIMLDTDEISSHSLTTKEIRECCKDIKVLGKKDIRLLINWRKKLKKVFEEANKPDEMEVDPAADESEDEDAAIEKKLAELQSEQTLERRRKRKKVMKEKRKLRDKMELKMVHPGDNIETGDDIELFNIKKMKSKHDLKEIQKEDLIDSDTESEDDELVGKSRKQIESYSRHNDEKDDEDNDDEEEDDEDEDEEDEDEDEDAEEEIEESEQNPLLVDLESKDAKVKRKTDMWFSKDMFSGLEAEGDEDLEIERMAEEYRKKGGVILGKESKTKKGKKGKLPDSEDSDHVSDDSMEIDGIHSDDDVYSDSDDTDSDGDSDFDVHANLQRSMVAQKRGARDARKVNRSGGKDGFEVVPANRPGKIIKLDPVELAIGEQLIKSSKTRREMEELSYNRYTRGDEDMPDWFAKDEAKHCRKQLPITKEQIDYYKERLNAINARPIKKIAEAKARKKRKMTKKLERARKKADTISDTVEMTDSEKWRQMRDVYKKAGLLKQKKREITYVIAKKGGGKKAVRPDGVKGFYRQVDARQKTDKRAERNRENRAKKGGKSKAKKTGRPRVRR